MGSKHQVSVFYRVQEDGPGESTPVERTPFRDDGCCGETYNPLPPIGCRQVGESIE